MLAARQLSPSVSFVVFHVFGDKKKFVDEQSSIVNVWKEQFWVIVRRLRELLLFNRKRRRLAP
jgi:hypothetical protein